jgi:hypothetical protein
MSFHRHAKLGLAGRYALVSAVAGGMRLKGGRGRLQRVAGDCASLVAPLAGRERSGRDELVVSVRSLEPAVSLATTTRAGA